jgi:riboflavin biosynthesis pyrimidine reductase
MVATVDGRATVEGRTAPMSSPADRELFHGLRTQADAVMVGARTAVLERYGRVVKSDALAARREAEGLEREPLAVLTSCSLGFTAQEIPLLQENDARVAIVTQADGEVAGAAADVSYVRGSLTEAMEALREEHGVRSVLCEGGPTLNRALLAEGLVDQLFLSVAPTLTGGDPMLAIVNGPELEDPPDLWLLSCHEAEDSLFLRYAVRRG